MDERQVAAFGGHAVVQSDAGQDMDEGGVLGLAQFLVVVSVAFARGEVVGQGDDVFLALGGLVVVARPAGDVAVADILLDECAAPQGVHIRVAEVGLVLFIVGLWCARPAPEFADVVE